MSTPDVSTPACTNAHDAPLSRTQARIRLAQSTEARSGLTVYLVADGTFLHASHTDQAGDLLKRRPALKEGQWAIDDAAQIALLGVQKSPFDAPKALADAVLSAGFERIHLVIGSLDASRMARLARALLEASYDFFAFQKPRPAQDVEVSLVLTTTHCDCMDCTCVQCECGKTPWVDYEAALSRVYALWAGQRLAKDVANCPPNICTPDYLAQTAQALGRAYPDALSVTVLDKEDMTKEGMGAFLAVAQGSSNEGRLAVMVYNPKHKTDAPLALVGKGITFDTGGISIKPSAGMDEMKFDMGGAAGVLGAMKALCEAGSDAHVVAILALAENMPSGTASRPGDVVVSMSGKTVEILNTDAEGRLVLADALTYAQTHYKPRAIVDVATLTGACVVALGHHRSGLFCNDEDLLQDIERAAVATGDLVWHMPMDEAYAKGLKSNFADLPNIAGRDGGAITAACFLRHFIEEGTAWAHLDIAGSAWHTGEHKGASGRPAALLAQLVLDS